MTWIPIKRGKVMNKLLSVFVVLICAVAAIALTTNLRSGEAFFVPTETVSAAKPGKTMKPFGSENELKEFFTRLAEKQRREAERRDGAASSNAAAKSASPIVNAEATTDSFGLAGKDEQITNTQ